MAIPGSQGAGSTGRSLSAWCGKPERLAEGWHMKTQEPAVEVLLPVHNEAESIEATIREIYSELSPRVPMRFVITEDGSTDGTKDVLEKLSRTYPMTLVMAEGRKGYANAVIDGMRELRAPYLLCLDSDGQCDPKDFWKFWDARESSEVLVGWRVTRHDFLWRRAASRTFYGLYQLLYHVPIHDPSCPFLLARAEVIKKLVPHLGEMKQGFWWEFNARAHRMGFRIREFPVRHRDRFAGQTRVYHFSKLPGIGYRHFIALFKIWRQTLPG
jgi:glycosyltransferase involved in cell wall biosynthesis